MKKGQGKPRIVQIRRVNRLFHKIFEKIVKEYKILDLTNFLDLSAV